jgi:hypothetical protein
MYFALMYNRYVFDVHGQCLCKQFLLTVFATLEEASLVMVS